MVTLQDTDGVLPHDVVPVFVAAVEKISKTWIKTPNQSSTQHSSKETSSSSSSASTKTSTAEDRLYNYASQCLQFGVLLMQLNDTEKEGDGERCIMNRKLLMLYFRSRQEICL